MAHYEKKAGDLKSEAGRQGALARGQEKVNHVHVHANDFHHMFAAHHHIQAAKDTIVHALSSHSTYGHSIDGKPSKPEGFVVSHQGRPTKLVHRSEFSQANLSRQDRPGRAK